MAKFSLAAHSRGAVRDPARLRLRHADGRGVPLRVAGHADEAAPLAADVHPASMAMGYELGVTPVQLAAAYGAIANDGMLLGAHADPRGARSRRARCCTGTSRSRCAGWSARGRRRAPRAAARRGGRRRHRDGGAARPATRCSARPARRAVSQDGSYSPASTPRHSPRLFPADDPQLVVIVKIDDPKGSLLRRRDRRARHPAHAPAGARVPPGARSTGAAGARATPACPRRRSPPAGPTARPITVVSWPYKASRLGHRRR